MQRDAEVFTTTNSRGPTPFVQITAEMKVANEPHDPRWPAVIMGTDSFWNSSSA